MKKKIETKINASESTPLKWPSGWERTQIRDRKPMAGWKGNFRSYRDAVVKELGRIEVTEVLISFNPAPSDRMDPGVAVYFSKPLEADYSWQLALGLDSPAPTLEQIEQAYREKAMVHHPDRGGDIEIFKQLGEHRKQARAWVLGTHSTEHEYSIPCDRFDEVRLNLNAIRLGLAALRQLERVGIPGALERTFRGLRTALPAQASSEGGTHAVPAA